MIAPYAAADDAFAIIGKPSSCKCRIAVSTEIMPPRRAAIVVAISFDSRSKSSLATSSWRITKPTKESLDRESVVGSVDLAVLEFVIAQVLDL
jgi:hypothetical protein